MTLTLSTWHVISLLLTMSGMLMAAGKLFFARFEDSMKERDKALEQVVKRLEIGHHDHTEKLHKLEREMLKMQNENTRIYVHKEDFNRSFTVVNAKLDRIWERLPKKGDE